MSPQRALKEEFEDLRAYMKLMSGAPEPGTRIPFHTLGKQSAPSLAACVNLRHVWLSLGAIVFEVHIKGCFRFATLPKIDISAPKTRWHNCGKGRSEADQSSPLFSDSSGICSYSLLVPTIQGLTERNSSSVGR